MRAGTELNNYVEFLSLVKKLLRKPIRELSTKHLDDIEGLSIY